MSECIYVQKSAIRLCDKLTLIAKRVVTDVKLLQPSPSAAAEKGDKIFQVYSIFLRTGPFTFPSEQNTFICMYMKLERRA